MAKNLEALLKKREALEQQIVAAQAMEKRKNEIVGMAEFVKLLGLPDAVLQTAFAKIVEENTRT